MPNTENAVSSILDNLSIDLTKNSGRKGRPEQTLMDGTTYEELCNQLEQGSVTLTSGEHWKNTDDLSSVVHRLRAALKGKHRNNPLSVSITKDVERDSMGSVRMKAEAMIVRLRQEGNDISDEKADDWVEKQVQDSQRMAEVITLTKA